MLRGYARQTVRAAEAEAVRDSGEDELMLIAAHAVKQTVEEAIENAGQRLAGSVILALIGGGDNGGDGLYAAAELVAAGAEVDAVLLHPKPHPRALAAASKAGVKLWEIDLDDVPTRLAEAVAEFARDAGVWIDAFTGSGNDQRLRRPARDVMRVLEREREASPDEPIVIAVDNPSGVGGDDGAIAGAHLRAHITVTMGAIKAAALLRPAAASHGRIRMVDLDLPYLGEPLVAMLEAADVGDRLVVPTASDHKYTRGVVQLISGCASYPMTGVLCALGAARAGAAMIRYQGPDEATLALISRLPEAVPGAGRFQALVGGPGIDASANDGRERVAALVDAIITARQSHLPVVLDAGALSLIRIAKGRAYIASEDGARVYLDGSFVLTPHAGEAAALLTALGAGAGSGGVTREWVEAQIGRSCVELAELTGATVVLKGGQTLVAGASGTLWVCSQAPAWAATAGSGDVLAGVIGAVLASHQAAASLAGANLDAEQVGELAAVAVWLHGRAARIAAQAIDTADDPRWLMLPERDGSRSARRIEQVATGAGRPIIASDIAAALPDAIAEALAAAG